MARDPAFLFYTGDFIAGIQDLTFEERGQYITLLCLQHQKGHLSEKLIKLSVGIAAADVMAKFRQDSAGLWYNARLDEEIEKRLIHSEKQQQRALEGWKTRKEKPNSNQKNATANATALPLENENINRNENTFNKKEFFSKIDLAQELFNDEIFVSNLQQTHRGKDLKQAFEECYTHHSNAPNPPVEIWEWRQKLNTWLTIKKPENGNSKKDATNARREAFAKRHSSGHSG